MNFWKLSNIWWSREEMKQWSSIRRTAYILLPLLIYFLIHDAAEILLWAALNQYMLVCGERMTEFLTDNAYTVRGFINGLAILFGILSIGKAVSVEIAGGTKGVREGSGKQKKSVPAGFGGRTKEAADGERAQGASSRSEQTQMVTGYIILAALALLAAMGLNFLFGAFGFMETSDSYAATAAAQYGVDFMAGLVLYGLVSPAAEEAVFRGLIFNRMKRCFKFPVALAVSSFLFGCYHGNVVQAVYGTLLGLLIAFCYERYGSFAAPVLFHAVANVSVYTFTYGSRIGAMSMRAEILGAVLALTGAGLCLWYIVKHIQNCREN